MGPGRLSVTVAQKRKNAKIPISTWYIEQPPQCKELHVAALEIP